MGDRLLDLTITAKKNPPSSSFILNPEAMNFLVKLHRLFQSQRHLLLRQREDMQHRLNQGENPKFLPETIAVRQDSSWHIAPTPSDLEKRWVEITGPTDRKMVINALNSGADIFMADFEDSNSPTWENMVEGQQNLKDAVAGSISFTSSEGKRYELDKNPAVLMVRPRGWHLVEKHLLIDGEPLSASLFDFGLYFFHNAHALLHKGTAPYFYLPKIESHLEARLWNNIFLFAQEELGIPSGTIRATVLIETILAAFEMDEILFELREHSAGLNAGRWDYIFSIIKKFQNCRDFLFPDRSQITMEVPFMRAYTHLLVDTCHRRRAHAIGGMAAFIPSRKDNVVNANALIKVKEDKERESEEGFDGTWVAHPDLVPLAREIFSKALRGQPNQKALQRKECLISSEKLLDFRIPGGKITEEGMRKNSAVAIHYLDSWLCGTGAVAINNLMEDTATAEISRAQLWQWIHHSNAFLDNGLQITPELYRRIADEEMDRLQKNFSGSSFGKKLFTARLLLDQMVISDKFPDFMTQIADDEVQ